MSDKKPTRLITHKCKYCGQTFKNKVYMKHLAFDHHDKTARDILEELKDL